MEIILCPKCLCPAAKFFVVQCMWHLQTTERILEEEEDRMHLNLLDNKVVPDLEMILLNYLPDDVPLDAKFTLNQTVHKLHIQAKLKLKCRHSGVKLQCSQNGGASNEAK